MTKSEFNFQQNKVHHWLKNLPNQLGVADLMYENNF
jgi:hypothetical protein